MKNQPRLSQAAALIAIVAILLPSRPLQAAYANYNSILIGDRAAGMGGAFTALTGDPAAGPFYNPASVARMPGSSLSANINAYNKYEVRYGAQSDFETAPMRLNRGFFRSLPTSSASLIGYGKFTVGLSIVLPDYDAFAGEVRSTPATSSFTSYVDESLWVGGTFSAWLTASESVGLTAYYTARSLLRSVNDTMLTGTTSAVITSEEKHLTNNSLIYVLGYQKLLPRGLSIGVSFRFPSIEVSGTGSYFRSRIVTDPFTTDSLSTGGLKSETKIPTRLAVGLAHETPGVRTLCLDLSLYGREQYKDLENAEPAAVDLVIHNPTLNAGIGAEHVIKPWLFWRMGAYSNFSSHPRPQLGDGFRNGDRIQMWGFSSNLSLKNQEKVSFTFGGSYTGGRGASVQQVGGALEIVTKNIQIFSMLLGSSYQF